jgi:hypothetical protein
MPHSNGKPEDPTSGGGWNDNDEDDNLSYTSGSSYSYTASSASDNEGPSKAEDTKPQQNGADCDNNDVGISGSENQPASPPSKQREWVDDVREDYNMLDHLKRYPAPPPVNDQEKGDEADKRSWLESECEESYADSFSSSDNESDGKPENASVPPVHSSEAPEPELEPAPPVRSTSPRERTPSPPRERTPSRPLTNRNLQMHGLMNEPTKQEEAEPEIQATQISVVSAMPQDRSESVTLDTIAEETQSKYTLPSDGSAAEIRTRSQEEKPEAEEPVVYRQNIPVGEPVDQPQGDRRSSISKKSSLLSSTIITDEQSFFDSHYRSLEDEPKQPVAIPLPSKSPEPEPRVDKVGNIEYIWDNECQATNMVVSEESPKECHRKRAIQATDAVRGKYDLIGGVHVFRFTFNDKPFGSHCSIGVCLEDAELSREGMHI